MKSLEDCLKEDNKLSILNEALQCVCALRTPRAFRYTRNLAQRFSRDIDNVAAVRQSQIVRVVDTHAANCNPDQGGVLLMMNIGLSVYEPANRVNGPT